MKPKYGNIKTNGYDSKKEAAYAEKLELLKNAEKSCERVVAIEKQVKYELIPKQVSDGKCVERSCTYTADFRVVYANGRVDIIDVKGFKTPDYIIKRKLMLYVFNIRVREV